MPEPQNVKQIIKQNSHIVDVFTTEQLIEAWESKTGKQIALDAGENLRNASNYAAAILDSKTVVKLIKDLGIDGRVILKTVGTKQYVIFKGYAGLRSIFTATRYLGTHLKVVDMAIGKIGLMKSVTSGARLTIFLIVPLNILNYILSDQATMTQLIGQTATDLVKIGVAATVSALAASAAATVTTLAAGPLIVAIVVGIAVGLALDALDKKFGVTDSLIKSLNEAIEKTDNMLNEFSRQMNQVERHLEWQATHGLPVGKGIFY